MSIRVGHAPARSSLSRTKPFSESHTICPLRIAGMLVEGAREPSRLEAAAEAGEVGSLPVHGSCMNQSWHKHAEGNCGRRSTHRYTAISSFIAIHAHPIVCPLGISTEIVVAEQHGAWCTHPRLLR